MFGGRPLGISKESSEFVEYIKNANGFKEIGTFPYANANVNEKSKIIKVDLKQSLGDTDIVFESINKLNWQSIVVTSTTPTNVEVLRKTKTGFIARKIVANSGGTDNYKNRVSMFISVKPSTQYNFTCDYTPNLAPQVFVFVDGSSISSSPGVSNGSMKCSFSTDENTTEIEIRIGLGSSSEAAYIYLGEWEFSNLMLQENVTGYAYSYTAYGKTYSIKDGESLLLSMPADTKNITVSNNFYEGVAKIYEYKLTEDDIPAYVDVEVEEVIGKLYGLQNGDTATIAFITDLHNGIEYSSYPGINNRLSAKHAIAGLGEIAKSCAIDYLCLGGDYVLNNTESTTKLSCFEQFRDIRDKVTEYVESIPKFWIRGNHDINPVTIDYSQRLTPDEILVRTGKLDRQNIIINEAEKDGMYGYTDMPLHKLRLVFLDLYRHLDHSVIDVNDHGISVTELKWILGNALNFSDKSDASEWGIIIFSHLPMYADFVNKADFISGLTAFKAGTSFVYDTETYDFSTQGAIDIIAAVAGDVHYDKSIVSDGILSISTQNASISSIIYAEVPADGVIYEKTPGTASETSYDIFTVDRKNGKLYATRYGAGVDREWNI